MKTIKYKDYEYQIPFEIVCTVSGAKKTYTSEVYINGKIDRFGGLDKLRATYVCRDAKKANKVANTPAAPVVKIDGSEAPIEAPKPVVTFEKLDPKPVVADTKTEEVCHNPAFLLDGKPCADCAFVGVCNYKDSPNGKKNVAKNMKKKLANK